MDFGTRTLNTLDPLANIEPIRISRQIDSAMFGVNFRFGPGAGKRSLWPNRFRLIRPGS